METILLCIVFTLFGLETLARFGAWAFAQWRVWIEIRESTEGDDTESPAPSSP